MKVSFLKKIFVFLGVFFIFYLLTTKGTFKIPYDVDYFNPLARSFLHGRLDIPNPVFTNDLSFFNHKWYLYWGPLPALFLIPFQLLKGRYIPAAYLSLVSAGFIGIILAAILNQIYKQYFPKINPWSKIVYWLFFLFGTSFIYVATRSGVWFVAQTISMFLVFCAFYFLIKKEMSRSDYFWASFFLSATLISRYSLSIGLIFLAFRLTDEIIFAKAKLSATKSKLLMALIPLIFFSTIFGLYNFARFQNPLEFGISYLDFSYFNFQKIAPFGFSSWHYIPQNLWIILLEIPQVTWINSQFKVLFNNAGNSIFFVSPVYLASFLTLNKNLFHNRLLIYLWVWVLCQFLVLTPMYSLSLLQFGIRYSLDFSLPLLTLAIFGLEGKVNVLIILATGMAIFLNLYSLSVI